MKKTVVIYCKNTKDYHSFPLGTSLLEIYKALNIKLKYQVVAARVNYKVENLNFLIYKPKDIEFIDTGCSSGMRVYVRSLSMVLSKAVSELFPQSVLWIEHPISKGYYCQIENFDQPITPEIVAQIKSKMEEIISRGEPIILEEKRTEQVKKLFQNGRNNTSKDALFNSLGEPYLRYYRIGNFIDYYTSILLPSTDYLDIFDLTPYYDGMLLQVPNRQNPVELEETIPQPKMFEIFKEFLSWNKIMDLKTVGELNKACLNKRAFNLIKIAEALHEKKVAYIADMIHDRPDVKIILVSGPSSSGKTTFSKRLSVQLMVSGLKPKIISLDNYFVNREDTPRDENGEWDFESLYALDLDFFHKQMEQLLEGKTVELPFFNFEKGTRFFKGEKLKLEKDTFLIIEGIHALNPELTKGIPEHTLFKVYVSALTTIAIDEHNWIPTADTRLLRRIIRDYRYRGYSARDTIRRWPSVRKGEDKWIFPYQENADIMFNSALIFELAVLKRHVIPILEQVPKYCDEYTETHRLLRFLRYFIAIPDREIPPTSLLREFVGGSSFKY
ncbi:MAG: nucleoside kinase [Bacteroidales bacterium]|nr:nucleoside kinase [Bacteroidales bacterium]